MEVKLLEEEHDAGKVEESIREIVSANRLCSLATVNEQGDEAPKAHIATAFFVYDDDLRFYVFTPPETDHGRQLAENPSVSLAIYDSHQNWTDEKQGLQIFGTAEQVSDDVIPDILDIYLDRYPGLEQFATNPEEVADLDSVFYEITPDRIKVFDEPTFGTEVWVNVQVNYRD